jgi:hypothetical protein
MHKILNTINRWNIEQEAVLNGGCDVTDFLPPYISCIWLPLCLFENRCVFCFGFMFGNRFIQDESRSTTEVPLYIKEQSITPVSDTPLLINVTWNSINHIFVHRHCKSTKWKFCRATSDGHPKGFNSPCAQPLALLLRPEDQILLEAAPEARSHRPLWIVALSRYSRLTPQ